MSKKINTLKELEVALKLNKFVILDFYADWCGPCKMYSPIFNDVAKERNDVKMFSIDVDNADQNLVEKFDVSSIPTTVAFKEGKEVKRFSGHVYKEELNKFIDGIKK